MTNFVISGNRLKPTLSTFGLRFSAGNSRTTLEADFVAIASLVTGKCVVAAFAMLLLTFTTDFAKIALATDNVQNLVVYPCCGCAYRYPPNSCRHPRTQAVTLVVHRWGLLCMQWFPARS